MRPAVLFAALCLATAASAQQPVPEPPARLVPRFTPGQVLRYQMEFRSNVESRTAGLVESPQAPARRELSVSILLRLEALSVEPPATARLRATYEKTTATLRSEMPDPDAAEIEKQYRRLEGRSMEFTMDENGAVRDLRGVEELLPAASQAEVERLVQQLAGFARSGTQRFAPGEKWTSEQPVPEAPLAGAAWRTETSYVRDENCPGAAAAEPERCALVLARSELTHSRANDPTPEEYRKRGLRTTGKMAGVVESLSYVSLRTGLLVSATQSVSEEADFTVFPPDRESSLRYTSRLESRSNIQLLPSAQP